MSFNKFILLLLLQSPIIAAQKIKEINENVEMQVRAVFINCDLNEIESTFPESESTRFVQEELFRHGSLTNCNKKLALTVKLTGETDGNSGDEYIPIEHVINGPSKRRTRLLNPYVLRLRREPPLQAYELRRIDTVSGILTNTDYEEDGNPDIKRHIPNFNQNVNWYQNNYRNNKENEDSVTMQELKQRENNIPENEKELSNLTFKNRFKRREYSNKTQNHFNDRSQMWIPTDNLVSEINFQQPVYEIDNRKYRTPEDESYNDPKMKNQRLIPSNYVKSAREAFEPKPISLLDNKLKTDVNVKYDDNFTSMRSEVESIQTETLNNIDSVEKAYALYEIGNPDMWSTVHVQLFEKISAPTGETVWNDVTKGESASVSSSFPDWGNENMNIRYQNMEWVAREDFTFPTAGLCLLTPIRDPESDHLVDNIRFINGQEYFVLPSDAIITLDDSSNLTKRSSKDSEHSSSTENIINEQFRRRVQIRLSRALFSGTDKKMSIASRGKDRFLTMQYRQPCRGQIDLEAKADENELVTVGSSGRITTAVSDSTRPTSTALTIQTTNNGLAAARFRAMVRECQPPLISEFCNKDSEEIITDRILIPPKQTRMFKLQVSNEVPVDSSHCSVALLNEFDEQVAVRDVTIKKDDRCFCVWHCDCVCLSEDPKLLCREMLVSRQIAAGFSSHNRRRHSRSVCYNDIVSVDMCVVIIGVTTTLLLLGLLKALIGLFVPSVRNWGLDGVLQTPRKLDHYYERSLSSRPVEYDADGWPVHPDTKKRTVHLISRPMEFVLNLIYFIVTPCLIVRNAIITIISRFRGPGKTEPEKTCAKGIRKCFSSHDMQSVEPRWRQRRGGLRRWMTPQAEEVSADLWRNVLPSQQPIKSEFMQPLLHEHHYHNRNGVIEGQDSCVDSEQDDTEFVLMQMQKSKESLRRSQRKLNDSEGLSKNYTKSRNLPSGKNN